QPVVLGSMVQKLYQQLCQEGDAHLDFSSIMHQYTTPPA
ncbi:MAG: 3-hydroxyisobutyrate dehydrogenase, partial [Acinetobacter sp.]